MRSSHVPPIAALRALEAAARHLSFTKAAEELHVTQSAISHQISYLEQAWALRLFERVPRGLALTREGEALASVVRGFLQQLRATLQSFTEGSAGPSIHISTTESFALAWLLPRLTSFREKIDDFDIWISTSEGLVDLGAGEFDAVVRLGDGNYPNLHVTFLLREYVFPVCSPLLLAKLSRPKRPQDLLNYPLLFRAPRLHSPDWEAWFRHVRMRAPVPTKGLRFQDSFMAVQAAIAGQGVALARSAHVVEFLRSGQLVRLCDESYPSPVGYYFVCPKDRASDSRIIALREWLLTEAARSQVEFQQQATEPNLKTVS